MLIRFVSDSNPEGKALAMREKLFDNGYSYNTIFKIENNLLVPETIINEQVVVYNIAELLHYNFSGAKPQPKISLKGGIKNQKIADIIIPHHTNNKDLHILLDMIAGQSKP